jgi:hypothetical protein
MGRDGSRWFLRARLSAASVAAVNLVAAPTRTCGMDER